MKDVTPIKEQVKEQKFMLQFVSRETGKRSEPFVTSWDKLYEALKDLEEQDNPKGDDYILLVCVIDGEQTRIPATPLITVDTFKSNYNFEEVSNG